MRWFRRKPPLVTMTEQEADDLIALMQDVKNVLQMNEGSKDSHMGRTRLRVESWLRS